MGLFRSYAKFKVGKKIFDEGLAFWRKRQRSKSRSRSKVGSRRR